MSSIRRIARFATLLTALCSLGACVLEPLGGGHGSGGREHEDRDHDDRGGERRLDYGVNQRGSLGLFVPEANAGGEPAARIAIFRPAAGRIAHKGLWA